MRTRAVACCPSRTATGSGRSGSAEQVRGQHDLVEAVAHQYPADVRDAQARGSGSRPSLRLRCSSRAMRARAFDVVAQRVDDRREMPRPRSGAATAAPLRSGIPTGCRGAAPEALTSRARARGAADLVCGDIAGQVRQLFLPVDVDAGQRPLNRCAIPLSPSIAHAAGKQLCRSVLLVAGADQVDRAADSVQSARPRCCRAAAGDRRGWGRNELAGRCRAGRCGSPGRAAGEPAAGIGVQGQQPVDGLFQAFQVKSRMPRAQSGRGGRWQAPQRHDGGADGKGVHTDPCLTGLPGVPAGFTV